MTLHTSVCITRSVTISTRTLFRKLFNYRSDLSCVRMDSFVLAETFKYLYLLFTEKEDVMFNMNQFIFTTEAHLLPLSLSTMAVNASASQVRPA